jgi:hypothetical protein
VSLIHRPVKTNGAGPPQVPGIDYDETEEPSAAGIVKRPAEPTKETPLERVKRAWGMDSVSEREKNEEELRELLENERALRFRPAASASPSPQPPQREVASPQEKKIPVRREAKAMNGQQPFVVRWRAAVCAERSLSIGTRYTLMALSMFMDAAGYCWPSQRTIAEAAGMGERTVRLHLSRAISEGWLRTTARTGARRLKPGRPGLAYQGLIQETA